MKLPLSGTRILELTHVWSGPLCGQVLADLGAEVIRVESRAHPDIHRRGGPYAGGVAGPNRSGTWNAQNRNKLGCTLDIRHGEGRALFLQLVAASDALIENFTPGTLQRLGIPFERLCEARADLQLLSLSGYGQTGPLRDCLAYGPMMDAACGLSAATSYDDGVPRAVNGWAADVGGALHGCAALVRALSMQPRRARHIDISQFEAGVLFAAGGLLDAMQGEPPRSSGVQLIARASGPEDWIAASARTLAELTALCDLLCGRERTAALLRAVQRGGTDAATDILQPAFTQWAATRTRTVALDELARAGVAAVPISRMADLLADAALRERDAWLEVSHPEAGASRNYGPAIRLQAGAQRVPPSARAAPLLGGDNEHVYGRILGLDEQRIAELARRGVI